jgi:hypothetical protein
MFVALMDNVYHCLNALIVYFSWLFGWMSAHGYPVDVITFDEWKKK